MYLANFKERIYNQSLSGLSDDKMLISCLNAHSFNILQVDKLYQSAIQKSDIVLPDGIAIVYALRFLTGMKISKISGHMLFAYEMERLNQANGKCFFLGSSKSTNFLIKMRASREFPNISVDSFSPPFKKEFTAEDDRIMIRKINDFNPDVLFIGMTAPKQEKWAAAHFEELNVKHICCIGAVFDFYAETCKRAPKWMIDMGFEWLHRLICEPKRLWRRYIFGNTQFIFLIFLEKLKLIGLNDSMPVHTKTEHKEVKINIANNLEFKPGKKL
jgi:N-acetylglucosaminyldiphosphoundecaprenol N-acetyl-beta-D-mannosaminyltransferase